MKQLLNAKHILKQTIFLWTTICSQYFQFELLIIFVHGKKIVGYQECTNIEYWAYFDQEIIFFFATEVKIE